MHQLIATAPFAKRRVALGAAILALIVPGSLASVPIRHSQTM